MKRIVMNKTVQGSPDGITILTFRKGEEYTTTERLAEVFVDELEVADLVREKGNKKKSTVPNNKAHNSSPENKMSRGGEDDDGGVKPPDAPDLPDDERKKLLLLKAANIGMDKDEIKKLESLSVKVIEKRIRKFQAEG